jgi:hypothetical protein
MGALIIFIQIIIGIGLVSILVYLVIRRVHTKRDEDFEQRDN